MKIREMIEKTNGRIFVVTFEKRTTGEMRKMVCRTKVTNGNPPYNFRERNLIPVIDMQAAKRGERAWRSIPVDNVINFKCGNMKYESTID